MTAIDQSIVDPTNEQVPSFSFHSAYIQPIKKAPFWRIISKKQSGILFQAVADFLGQVTRAWEKDRGVLIKEQVCSYLGGQLENYCIEFLAEYTDDIIDMLVNIFEIFFCSAKKIFLLKPKKIAKIRAIQGRESTPKKYLI